MGTTMKLSDIPKLTELLYIIDTDVRWLKTTCERYSKSYGGFDMDPDFQRGHVWTEEQQIKFLEFVVRGGKTPPIVFNSPDFAGTVRTQSNAPRDLPSTMVVVDGKQRLTALLKFIDNQLPVFGHYLDEFEDKERFLRGFSIKIAVNNVANRAELLKWYLEMNEGLTAHTAEELDRVRSLIEKNDKN